MTQKEFKEALLKVERQRIWGELCKGENETAFCSTIELDADDVYRVIFNQGTITP